MLKDVPLLEQGEGCLGSSTFKRPMVILQHSEYIKAEHLGVPVVLK